MSAAGTTTRNVDALIAAVKEEIAAEKAARRESSRDVNRLFGVALDAFKEARMLVEWREVIDENAERAARARKSGKSRYGS